MSRLLAVLLLGTLAATFGCGKTETAQAPAADITAAPVDAPSAEKVAEPAKVEPASSEKPADAPAAGDKPAGEEKPEEKPAEPKSTTDARPTVLLKLLTKPMTDAMDELTKSLPAPQMGGGR